MTFDICHYFIFILPGTADENGLKVIFPPVQGSFFFLKKKSGGFRKDLPVTKELSKPDPVQLVMGNPQKHLIHELTPPQAR